MHKGPSRGGRPLIGRHIGHIVYGDNREAYRAHRDRTNRSNAWPRRVALLLFVALCYGVGQVSTAGAVVTFRVHTYNLAMGNPDHVNYSKHDVALNNTIDQVSAWPDWQLSLTESCSSQANIIVWNLNGYHGAIYGGYYFGYASDGTVACHDGSGPFGNTIAAVGGYVGANYLVFDKPPGKNESKNIICITMNNFGFNTLNCTLHLTNYGDDSWPLHQMFQARFVAAAWSGPWGPSLPIVAGDFNIHYANPPWLMPSEFQNSVSAELR